MECFILAGGQSRRFGTDKLLEPINSKRTIDYVVASAKEVFPKVYVVAKDKRKFGDLGVPIVEDLLQEQTPLVGIYTALELSPRERVAILSGDMPLIRPEVLRLLKERAKGSITVFRVGGKVYPLVGVYSTFLKRELYEFLKQGKKRVMDFLSRVGCFYIEEDEVREVDPELCSFVNMNTREDLERVKEWILRES